VFECTDGIPFLYASREQRGSYVVSNLGGVRYDPNAYIIEYKTDAYDIYQGVPTRDIAGWRRVDESFSNTPTKLSSQLTFSAVRTLTQATPPDSLPEDATPLSEFYKATTTQFDDYMTRLCAAARVTVVKSCRWIPKQTQMFMTIERDTYHPSGGIPGGWGYYGGTVPEEDRLEMLDQYRSTGRSQVEPTGGRIVFQIRRTWQIELVIASGAPTYTPMEVINDDLKTTVRWADTRWGGRLGGIVDYTGTRTAKCKVEFDVESAETTTHLMNHQQLVEKNFYFTEAEWERLEAGEAIERDIYGGSTSRIMPIIDIQQVTWIDTNTKVVFQFT
jgi:hypothetical protein